MKLLEKQKPKTPTTLQLDKEYTMQLTKDFHTIALNEIPLIDVRAPIEYEKGAFKGSINLPIMTDEERHLVGIKYKNAGNEAATELGHEFVSGEVKEARVNAWISFIKEHPNAMLYCFRGGSRSRISQEWLEEAGYKVTRLEGGYKAYRNYLMDELEAEAQTAKPIVLSGYTGSGKTILLNELDNTVDLEGIAHHRGSAFGGHIDAQPSQINFENNLAYRLIQHRAKGYSHMILEDESRNVGRCFIPKDLLDYFRSGPYVLLEVSLADRVMITYDEYVTESQASHIERYGDDGINKWYAYIDESMNKAKKRLGGERFNAVQELLEVAHTHQLSTNDPTRHKDWIELFLRDYYDPMYKYQLEQAGDDKFAFKGNKEAVIAYIKNL